MSDDVGTGIDIGIIGGSGLYEMEGLTVLSERRVETPFGEPSDSYVVGEMDGIRVAFLSRHGRGHRKMPTEINYRANLFGFKLGMASSRMSASPIQSAPEPPVSPPAPPARQARTYMKVASTSAWKARSSQPARNRISIARGASTSSV